MSYKLKILNFLFPKETHLFYCLKNYDCNWFRDSGIIVCEGCNHRCIVSKKKGEKDEGTN